MSFFISKQCNGCTACEKICPTGAISGEKKTRHLVDEALCINCRACGKVCPKSAVKDETGQMVQRLKRSLWEFPRFDQILCTACVICIDACPAGCISLSLPGSPKDPHAYPEILDTKACIGCGFCSLECPVGAIEMLTG